MQIAILGTGRMGQTLGRLWAAAGHQIIYGSRQPQQVTPDHPARILTQAEASAAADHIVFAFPWFALTDVLRATEGVLSDQVIIDCINPLRSSGSLALGHSWSAGEEIAKLLPRARVVKALNHLYWTTLVQPTFDGQRASAFYCGNDDGAKKSVAGLIADLGLEPVDAGPLKNARLLEPLAALTLQLMFVAHHGPDVALRLIRRAG